MTYSDNFNIRAPSAKFNDIADAIDSTMTRTYVTTTTGSSTSYIVSPSPKWESYNDYPVVTIIPHTTNTAGSPSVTVNISGLGVLPIKYGGVDIPPNTLIAGIPVILIYNGSRFEISISENSIRPDGTNIVTGNLNIGSYKIGSLGDGTLRTDAVTAKQAQNQSANWLGTTTGNSGGASATASPALPEFLAGQTFTMLTGTGASPSATTFPVSFGLVVNTASSILRHEDGADYSLTGGSFVDNSLVDVTCDDELGLRISSNSSGWQYYAVTTTIFTGTAPNVVSAINTLEVSRYIRIGRTVVWEIGIGFNLGTGGNPYLNIRPPVRASSSISASNCFIRGTYAADSAAATFPVFFFTSTTNLRIGRNALSAQNWAASATCYLRGVITYEAYVG